MEQERGKMYWLSLQSSFSCGLFPEHVCCGHVKIDSGLTLTF